mgnify:CR=1 FL=1
MCKVFTVHYDDSKAYDLSGNTDLLDRIAQGVIEISVSDNCNATAHVVTFNEYIKKSWENMTPEDKLATIDYAIYLRQEYDEPEEVDYSDIQIARQFGA